MIPIAVALCLSSPGSTGKTMNDLAKVVATLAKRPAIAVLPSYDKVSIPDDPKSIDDIVSPLRKLGFASLESDVAIVYQQGIPRSHWGVLRNLVSKEQKADVSFKPVTISQSSVKDNTITFETKDTEAVKLGSLMELNLPRRIVVSPYYNFDNSADFPLAISAKDMPVSDFVKALSRGLGGTLQVDPKTYTIAFGASAFRANVAKLIALAQQGVNEGRQPAGVVQQFNGGNYNEYQEYQDASQPPQSSTKQGLTAALQLLGSTINQMSDQLLEQTFAYKGTSTRINLGNYTALQQPAVGYLEAASTKETQDGAQINRRPRPGQNLGGTPTDFSSLIRRVDPRNPGHIVITTDFRLTLELNVSQRGRPTNGGTPPPVAADGNTVTVQVL